MLLSIELPKIISSSDVDSLAKNYDNIRTNVNYVRALQESIKDKLLLLNERIDNLIIAVIVMAIILAITIFVVIFSTFYRNNFTSNKKSKSIMTLPESIEKKAYGRVEDLFYDVIFDESNDMVKLNKGFAELFYIAFQFSLCNIDSPQLKVATVSKLCERNKIFCENMVKVDASVYTELDSIINSVDEAIKSGSPFLMQSCMRTRLSNNIYEQLVEQKNVLKEIIKWLDDSNDFIEYRSNNKRY